MADLCSNCGTALYGRHGQGVAGAGAYCENCGEPYTQLRTSLVQAVKALDSEKMLSDALLLLDETLSALHDLIYDEDAIGVDDDDQADAQEYQELDNRRDELVRRYRESIEASNG